VKALKSIIEDSSGHVIGASTDEGDVMLPSEQSFPRAELRDRAETLATQYGITIPPELAESLQGV
jgi:hypothetical protein